jgi:DNA-directed RNA polymerase subunit delta
MLDNPTTPDYQYGLPPVNSPGREPANRVRRTLIQRVNRPFCLRTDLMWDRLEQLAFLDVPDTTLPGLDDRFAPPLLNRHPGDEEEEFAEDIEDDEDEDDEFDDDLDDEDDDLDDDLEDDEDLEDEEDLSEIDDLDLDEEEELDEDEDDDLDDLDDDDEEEEDEDLDEI